MLKHSLEDSGQIDVEGGHIGYRRYIPHSKEAQSRIPLVLVHGGPGGSHIHMYNALHKIANTRPVIGYDQLGSHLSSTKDVSGNLLTVERFAEEPLHLLNSLGYKDAVFLGQSWGGVVISEFALNHPDRVAGLVYSAPLISTQRWVDDCQKLLSKLPQHFQDSIRCCEANGTTDSEEYQAADAYFAKRHFIRSAQQRKLRSESPSYTNLEVYNTMWGPSEFSHHGTLGDLDLFPRLKELETDVLIICGEHDTATPETMRDVQKEIRGSELYVVPNAGHSVYADGNRNYVRVLTEFLHRRIDQNKTRVPQNGASGLNP